MLADAVGRSEGQPAPTRAPPRFLSAGQRWWAQIRPFDLGPQRALSVVVAVPETDLLGGLGAASALDHCPHRGRARPRHPVGGRAGAPATAGPSRPWCARATGSAGATSSAESRSARVVAEMQRLASAHEHMRDALRTLFKMERDLRLARQIQLSTLPETLPSPARVRARRLERTGRGHRGRHLRRHWARRGPGRVVSAGLWTGRCSCSPTRGTRNRPGPARSPR